MELLTNIPDIIKRLEQIKAAVGGGAGGNGGDITVPSSPDFSDAIFASLNSGMGLMKRRIFNNREDAEGKSLGNYHGTETRVTKRKLSIAQDDEDAEKQRKKRKRVINRTIKESPDEKYTEYEKYRLSLGRQIEGKDLEVTGSLRRAIETVKTSDGSKVVIAILGQEEGKIARYQEQQIGNIRAGENAKTGSAEPAKIFILSKTEFNQVRNEGNRAIAEVIKEKFRQ
ncbi:MAG: hypothetical protein WKF88_09330 [Ferruginibacter sp.]